MLSPEWMTYGLSNCPEKLGRISNVGGKIPRVQLVFTLI